MPREAQSSRKTKETDISVTLRLDGAGEGRISTTVPFFDHMLTLFARHGFFDLAVAAKGDTDVDFHHIVEDVGICLGEAFRRALGDMTGIARYGHASLPMIEALAEVSVDVSARPHLVFRCPLAREKVGTFDVELVEEFLRAFSQSSGICLHVNVPYGSNAHHTVEAVFKGLGRAMSDAVRPDPRVRGVHSSKGVLG
ncbi:MAG: imidazoleglycerol-phosphate dehydratase [Deltaproteobacteria bacterium GWC2_65_14]|nr:MAG: imidazoleglycerol-phosphate dehydratase [Deltaproteobacteria bacterium GWC2_65_14]